MPTLHRLACFRDDIIFFIYLYQKWIYDVDYSRQNEFGQEATAEEQRLAKGQETTTATTTPSDSTTTTASIVAVIDAPVVDTTAPIVDTAAPIVDTAAPVVAVAAAVLVE